MEIRDLQGIATKQGVIWNLSFDEWQHVAVIECIEGQERSHHYHRDHGHWLYVAHGAMDYDESRLDGSHPHHARLVRGQMVYTAPGLVHRCGKFDKVTTLVSLSMHNSQEAYSADTVKQDFR